MKRTCSTLIAGFILTLVNSFGIALQAHAENAPNTCASPFDSERQRLHSDQRVDLCSLTQGKVVLLVNTASQCGFTPQFKDLESLYQQYQSQEFTIIGLPSDDFNQEHDDEARTASVCYRNYGVSFPMLATGKVIGPNADPLFQAAAASLSAPRWNFTKYLIAPDGRFVAQFGSQVDPLSTEIRTQIESLLP